MHFTRPTTVFLYYYGTIVTFLFATISLYLAVTRGSSPAGGLAFLPLSLYFLYRSFKQTRSNQLYAASHPAQPLPKYYSVYLTITLYIIALGITLLRGYTHLVLAIGSTP